MVAVTKLCAVDFATIVGQRVSPDIYYWIRQKLVSCSVPRVLRYLYIYIYSGFRAMCEILIAICVSQNFARACVKYRKKVHRTLVYMESNIIRHRRKTSYRGNLPVDMEVQTQTPLQTPLRRSPRNPRRIQIARKRSFLRRRVIKSNSPNWGRY